jgi:hypothetical protein
LFFFSFSVVLTRSVFADRLHTVPRIKGRPGAMVVEAAHLLRHS